MHFQQYPGKSLCNWISLALHNVVLCVININLENKERLTNFPYASHPKQSKKYILSFKNSFRGSSLTNDSIATFIDHLVGVDG